MILLKSQEQKLEWFVGIGSFTNGKELPLKYQVFKDREGEWMIEYKTI